MKLEQLQKVKDILIIRLRKPSCAFCELALEDCSFKKCSWSISESYAEELAKEIVSSICEVDE